MRALAVLVPVLFLVPTAVALPSPDEFPTDGACDSSGLLVCAGANVGADADCALVGADASCSFTYGHIHLAYSPVGLPGRSEGNVTTTVTTCRASGCVSETFHEAFACPWTNGLEGCGGGDAAGGAWTAPDLAMGECARLEVDQRVEIVGTAGVGASTLATARWVDTNKAAGAVCRVDDGRDS